LIHPFHLLFFVSAEAQTIRESFVVLPANQHSLANQILNHNEESPTKRRKVLSSTPMTPEQVLNCFLREVTNNFYTGHLKETTFTALMASILSEYMSDLDGVKVLHQPQICETRARPDITICEWTDDKGLSWPLCAIEYKHGVLTPTITQCRSRAIQLWRCKQVFRPLLGLAINQYFETHMELYVPILSKENTLPVLGCIFLIATKSHQHEPQQCADVIAILKHAIRCVQESAVMTPMEPVALDIEYISLELGDDEDE
jgi:hypothetical protein